MAYWLLLPFVITNIFIIVIVIANIFVVFIDYHHPAAGLVLFLPETKGVSPPSTVEEGERLSREENLTMMRRTRTVMLMFQGGGRAQLVLQEEPPSSSWCWRTTQQSLHDHLVHQ